VEHVPLREGENQGNSSRVKEKLNEREERGRGVVLSRNQDEKYSFSHGGKETNGTGNRMKFIGKYDVLTW